MQSGVSVYSCVEEGIEEYILQPHVLVTETPTVP
jgi:hypothetical protein